MTSMLPLWEILLFGLVIALLMMGAWIFGYSVGRRDERWFRVLRERRLQVEDVDLAIAPLNLGITKRIWLKNQLSKDGLL